MPKKKMTLESLLDEQVLKRKRRAGKSLTFSAPTLQATRSARAGAPHWLPEPEPHHFNVTVGLDSVGNVHLTWESGTKSRGNKWEVKLSFSDLTDIHTTASAVKARSLDQDLELARLNAECWSALLKGIAPGQFEERKAEVWDFIYGKPTRRKSPSR